MQMRPLEEEGEGRFSVPVAGAGRWMALAWRNPAERNATVELRKEMLE